MPRAFCEAKLRTLVNHAWDREVDWHEIEAWASNFSGEFLSADEEQVHALLGLTAFVYFSRRMVREMLRALFRDRFEAKLIQRLRRANGNTRDALFLRTLFQGQMSVTRFIGVGNPSESGAHLLYFFRQINRISKNNFADIAGAFEPYDDGGVIKLRPRDPTIRRFVFFDDLIGSGTQASSYLSNQLAAIRAHDPTIELCFLSLFATTVGLRVLNRPALFNGRAECLFELDKTYRAFSKVSRYFRGAPSWFDRKKLFQVAVGYGKKVKPRIPLGYKRGQLLLGFSYNTPDNVPPIFWYDGKRLPWNPVFMRYEKIY